METETPILSKSTPEGACDYLVPSRIQPREFYALPQSPQLFKQVLMVSGYDRYYQIARCFWDEDLRAGRQLEFRQRDMELAFTPREDMLKLNEDLIRHAFHEIRGIKLPISFPRVTYTEAMDQYGFDRPDLRIKMKLANVSEVFLGSNFQIFVDILVFGEVIKALAVPSGSSKYSNMNLKKGDIYKEAVKFGAKGLPFLKVLENGQLEGITTLISSLENGKREEFLNLCSAKPGDLILFALGHSSIMNKTLGHLRTFITHDLRLIDNSASGLMKVKDESNMLVAKATTCLNAHSMRNKSLGRCNKLHVHNLDELISCSQSQQLAALGDSVVKEATQFSALVGRISRPDDGLQSYKQILWGKNK